MEWFALGVITVLIIGIVVWRMRRRRNFRIISFVGLLREPASFDAAIVARLASKAWNVDLGDGQSEGADGFVVGVGILTTISYGNRFYLINSFPNPYSTKKEKDAEAIADLRIRQLFLDHTAWFSCDAMGVDGRTPEQEIRGLYSRLGKLFAELVDDNCTMIYLPDRRLGYPINEDTEAALCSDDPLAALQQTLTLPVIAVSHDDPDMKKAVAEARKRWPEFVEAFERRAGENFSAKAPVTMAGNTEFIWISVKSLEGERIYGELGNDPANLGPLKLGSKVSVPLADLNDWIYIDPKGEMVGGFTIKVVQEAAKKKQ